MRHRRHRHWHGHPRHDGPPPPPWAHDEAHAHWHGGWHGWHGGPWDHDPWWRRRRHRGLRRRLFAWFGLAIVVTGLTVGATFNALSAYSPRSWRRQLAGIERFVGGRFAAVWHAPAARDELAHAMARDLGLGVRVRDASGAVLTDAYVPPACRHWQPVRVFAPGEAPPGFPNGTNAPDVPPPPGPQLGRVDVCLDGVHGGMGAGWHMPAALALACAILWAMSGVVARRLTRPLFELTRVARKLGDGDLAARARLCGQYDGEVAELAGAMNDMADRIEKQMRDQRELLATVSHELRTPLTRIRLLLELARDSGGVAPDGGATSTTTTTTTTSAPPRATPAPAVQSTPPGTSDAPAPSRPGARDPLAEIDGEVVEIDALVADLLASARMDFSALAPRELDAEQTARRALERAQLPDAAVELVSDPGALVADATLLSRSLSILLDNARKYGGGRVTLRVRGGPDSVAFEVDDQGTGFAPGDEERVFEPFYRGQRAEREEQPRGVGLGLALVKRIAEAHGGRAYASNLPGRGARVAVELPRVARDARAARSSQPTAL